MILFNALADAALILALHFDDRRCGLAHLNTGSADLVTSAISGLLTLGTTILATRACGCLLSAAFGRIDAGSVVLLALVDLHRTRTENR
jgi:hypothetical protein